jgi:hypothetical protein
MNRSKSQRALLATSIDWMTTFYDADALLLRHPSAPQRHAVRESLWYAAGLLAQRENDRVARALTIVDAVLDLQFEEPGAIWDGTWPRAPEERRPEPGAVIWRDYDPNWRQFIGCLLGLLACDFSDVLGQARCARVRDAIALALRGERSERIAPGYSNIALMQAWLLAECGDRSRGERLASAVEDLYRADGGFREFNSPTYYGVDLWGLALWRRSGSALLAAAGRRLEAALWRDIADLYHPGLRNLCGPYDRAYGIDMTRYASLLGLWLWWACGDAARAFPDTTRSFGHAHDFCAAPLIALAPPAMSEATEAALIEPVTNRRIERRSADRTVTAQLRGDLMLGAIDPGRDDATGQSMPITAHWFDSSGRVAGVCIRGAPLRGVVGDASITVCAEAELVLQCPASPANAFGERSWFIGDRRIEVAHVDVLQVSARGDQMRCALRLPTGEGRLCFT